MADNSDNNGKSNHGYVYILSNPSMPGLLKIGITRFDPTKRVQELSSATGVPTQFQLIYYREFHNCVAAELEIHSILAAKGMRYNDQREFFSVDSVDAINTLLSLEDECVDEVSEDLVEVRNFNEDIDWNADYLEKKLRRESIEKTSLYQEYMEFKHSVLFKYPYSNDDTNKLQEYVRMGFVDSVDCLASRLFSDVDEQTSFILQYASKGYVSGYIDVIRNYLSSIEGIDNLVQDKKVWIATMLNYFAIEYRNASVYDFYVMQEIVFYCGISCALGLQYDKSFLKALSLDDDSVFDETWLWGYFNDSEGKSKNLVDKLRADKDLYCGTSTQLRNAILNDVSYKKYHSVEGESLYRQGWQYVYSSNKNIQKAQELLEEAIEKGCKKAYIPLVFLYFQDYDKRSEILQQGACDSCPQCLMMTVDRLLCGVCSPKEITNSMRHKIYRYLDLFFAQIDIAFWVDAESCLDAIKTFVSVSIAFQRKFNKGRLKNVIDKIKAIGEIDLDSYYSNMGDSIACFYDDFDLIEQEAILTMKELAGLGDC